MPPGGVGQPLHFEETNLIKTASKDVDDVAIVCCSLGEIVVELPLSVSKPGVDKMCTHLQRFLIVFDVVTIDIMM